MPAGSSTGGTTRHGADRDPLGLDREEAFFNGGYEHGLADGLARARRGSIRLSKEVQ